MLLSKFNSTMLGPYTEKTEDDIGTIKIVDELVSFAWNIDWSLCQKKKCGEFIQSPSFSTLSDNGKVLEWRLQLYPDGVTRKYRGHMSLYLRTLREENRDFLLQHRDLLVAHFHLLNNQGEVINKVSGELFSQVKRYTCGLDRFIRKDLFEHNASDVLNYGKLTVVCTVADTRTESKFSFSGSKQPDSPLPLRPLSGNKSLGDQTSEDDDDDEEEAKEPPSNQFEAMLNGGKHDVIIVIGDRRLCAHRAILSARSSFFQSVFEQDVTQRKRVSIVDMNEFTADAVIELMRYLYLNRVDKLEERASLLLAPANKYVLEKLKNQCEEAMIKGLDVRNASEYLVLSFLHEASKLQEKAMDFVVGHSLDVVNTPGFKAIAGSHANVIGAIILKTIATRGKEQVQIEEPTWIRKKNHCAGKLCEQRKKLWENRD